MRNRQCTERANDSRDYYRVMTCFGTDVSPRDVQIHPVSEYKNSDEFSGSKFCFIIKDFRHHNGSA